MTPAPPPLAPSRARVREILTAVLGVVLLAALFLPARDPVTHRLAAEWRPSAELAGVLFLIAMAALASPRLVAERGFAFVLALLVVGAALLNLADTATPSLLGRDLNLYWDLQHLPSLFGLARDSAGLWSASVAVALLVAAVSLVIAGAYWIWRRVLASLADRRIAIGAAVLLGVALDVTSFLPAEQRPLATGLGSRHRPTSRGIRTRVAGGGRGRGTATDRARILGPSRQQSCRPQATRRLSRLHRILRHDGFRHAGVSLRIARVRSLTSRRRCAQPATRWRRTGWCRRRLGAGPGWPMRPSPVGSAWTIRFSTPSCSVPAARCCPATSRTRAGVRSR